MVSNSFEANSNLLDHGFLFVLKFLLLKGVLLDHLQYMEDIGINYLDELLYHFNFINEQNIGKGYSERSGNPEEYFGKSDVGEAKEHFQSLDSNHREQRSSSPNLVNHGF